MSEFLALCDEGHATIKVEDIKKAVRTEDLSGAAGKGEPESRGAKLSEGLDRTERDLVNPY